jgi:hypothetical protein
MVLSLLHVIPPSDRNADYAEWIDKVELKLMTGRKYQNSRFLGAARIQKFPHKALYYMTKTMEYDIIDSK